MTDQRDDREHDRVRREREIERTLERIRRGLDSLVDEPDVPPAHLFRPEGPRER